MNRNDFLKKLGFGALAVAIAPKVLAETPAKDENKEMLEWTKDTFHSRKYPKTFDECYKVMEARLYYKDKEVYYKGYSRQDVKVETKVEVNSITLKPESFSFPPAPRKKRIKFDSVKLFDREQEKIIWYLGEKWFSANGALTLQW